MNIRILIFISFVFCFNLVYSQDLNYSTIDNALIEEIEDKSETNFEIYVILEDKVDVESLDRQLTAARVSPEVRLKTVLTALQTKASSSQALLIDDMKKHNGVLEETINSYWIANVVFLTANEEAIAALSNDDRIEFIGLDGELELEATIEEGPATVVPDGVENGLEAINVRPMWEMGYTGYGQLALVADTGVDPSHRAFANRYRGNTNSDNEGWFAYEGQSESPFQCGGHGSHVLGILMGLNVSSRDTIGVAFDAQWMGSANLCSGGTQSNVGMFEWSTNPDGNLDTSEDMADVINNSWWDPSVQNSPCNNIYVDVLTAVEAAGVAVVFSAGNAGPGPETITAPKSVNVDLVNTFSVASVNANATNIVVSGFSSRGPSVCGGEGSLLIKPEVSAPGDNVRSADLDNEYINRSGTSMASPHVAGSIIVLKQAFPNATSRELKMALYRSCKDLGEPGEDNTYGAGLIDVYAAYQYMIAEGFEPQPAISSDFDVMALGLDTDPIECNSALSGTFSFLNNNSDTLRSLDISVYIDGALDDDLSLTWTGILGPNEISSIPLERSSFSSGTHNIEVVLSQPNGMVDERVLNNSSSSDVVFSERMQLLNLEIEDQNTCRESETLVKTEFDGDGVVKWYDSPEGGNLIGEGTQFTLAVPEGRTIIYGDLVRLGNAGIGRVNPAELNLSNSRTEGVTFDVNEPSRITALDFYSESPGNIFIGVENGRGEQIESELVRSDGSGWQTVEVSINLSQGVNYRMLYKDGVIELGSLNNGANYPYSDIEGSLTITGDEFGGQNSIKNFFNFQVEYSDFCGRIPVEVNSYPNTEDGPTAIFDADISLVDLDDNQSVSFTNNSINGVSYFWDFGDGNTSTEEEPSHTYTEPGVYYTSLLVRGASGCDDASVIRIEVFSTETTTSTRDIVDVNSFTIAPNPVSSQINFMTGSPIEVSEIKLYNSAGQLIGLYPINGQISRHSIDMDDMTSGLYYFIIQTATGLETHKVVKL